MLLEESQELLIHKHSVELLSTVICIIAINIEVYPIIIEYNYSMRLTSGSKFVKQSVYKEFPGP